MTTTLHLPKRETLDVAEFAAVNLVKANTGVDLSAVRKTRTSRYIGRHWNPTALVTALRKLGVQAVTAKFEPNGDCQHCDTEPVGQASVRLYDGDHYDDQICYRCAPTVVT